MEETPWINGYNYVLNNPIFMIDPTGMAGMPYKDLYSNVARLYQEVDGSNPIENLVPPGDYCDKRGNNIGNDGLNDNKIYLVNDGVTSQSLGLGMGEFVSSFYNESRQRNTVEVGGLMILNRNSESSNSTNGEMTMIDRNGKDFVYSLEPRGPESAKENQNQRIPDGIYNVDNYSSKKYPDNYILSNEVVTRNRLILIHSGNSPEETKGCILPGCNSGAGTVGYSKDAMNAIRSFIKTNNISVVDRRDNIKMIIRTNIN